MLDRLLHRAWYTALGDAMARHFPDAERVGSARTPTWRRRDHAGRELLVAVDRSHADLRVEEAAAATARQRTGAVVIWNVGEDGAGTALVETDGGLDRLRLGEHISAALDGATATGFVSALLQDGATALVTDVRAPDAESLDGAVARLAVLAPAALRLATAVDAAFAEAAAPAAPPRLPVDPETGMPRLVPAPPPGQLDHDGYQQLLDHIATELADVTFSTPSAEAELREGAAFEARAGLQLVADYSERVAAALEPALPPAEVAAQHAALVAAYREFASAARELGSDPRFTEDPSGLEAAMGAMPAAAATEAATQAVADAGYHVTID